MLRREVKMVLSSPWIWLTVGLVTVSLFIMRKTTLFASYTLELAEGVLTVPHSSPSKCVIGMLGNKLSKFFPVVCGVPAALFSCEEWNSGFNRMQLTRITPGKYMAKKVVSVGLAGALILGIPAFIMWLIPVLRGAYSDYAFVLSSDIFYGYLEDQVFTRQLMSSSIRDVIYPIIAADPDAFYFLGEMGQIEVFRQLPLSVYVFADVKLAAAAFLQCLMVGFGWSMFALAVSAWVPNRYITLLLPVLVLQYVNIFMPVEWGCFVSSYCVIGYPYSSLMTTVFAQAIRCCLSLVLYAWGIGRRAQNG